jgi:vancomycin resistance protein YoaR
VNKVELKPSLKIWSKIGWGFLWGLSSLFIAANIFLYFYYQSRFFPNTNLSYYDQEMDLSQLNIKSAQEELEKNQVETSFVLDLIIPEEATLSTNTSFESHSQVGVQIDIEETINQSFEQQHHNYNPLLYIRNIFQANSFKATWEADQNKLDEVFNKFNQELLNPGQTPQIAWSGGYFEIDPGQTGFKLDKERTQQKITQALQQDPLPGYLDLTAELTQTNQELTPEEIETGDKLANQLYDLNLKLTNSDHPEIKIKITPQELLAFIDLQPNFNNNSDSSFSTEKITQFLEEKNQEIKRDPQNAVLKINQEKEKPSVEEFTPSRPGLSIEIEPTTQEILSYLKEFKQNPPTKEDSSYSQEINLSLIATQPEVTLDETNDLGIKERIGFGDSLYYHSIPNRIHNVSITADRINNILIAPGEEFSFNRTLGEVSRATGYRSAYVISDGKTTLGDGGGVCQVSTTIFRAALNAGLPITKRLPHSYRVSYYELNNKPGIDATVYAGDVDLRFKNDTGHYLLLHSEAFPDDLYMKVEIYGTSDGRTTEIVDHKTWGYRPAPAAVYYPTPDLPTGVVEQIDWAVAGIKASFKNVIKDKNGEVIREEEYYSNYQPWSAKYLVGE